MTTIKRVTIISLSTFTGALLIFLFNASILDKILIPDPCYYHNHGFKTTKVFDLFYEFTSSEGYHPTPTLFNIIFTLIIGGLLGFTISTYKTKKRNDVKNNYS